jgi:hypothetical protein
MPTNPAATEKAAAMTAKIPALAKKSELLEPELKGTPQYAQKLLFSSSIFFPHFSQFKLFAFFCYRATLCLFNSISKFNPTLGAGPTAATKLPIQWQPSTTKENTTYNIWMLTEATIATQPQAASQLTCCVTRRFTPRTTQKYTLSAYGANEEAS